MSKQDEIIKGFPEVEWAVGKAGRAETSTDPSPTNMNETIVHLKPDGEWRSGMTREKLVSEMDATLRMPGVTNIWTQPIINRIEMLSTGIRSQVGMKVFGNDLKTLEHVSRQVAERRQNSSGCGGCLSRTDRRLAVYRHRDRPASSRALRHRRRDDSGHYRKRHRRNEPFRDDRGPAAISRSCSLRTGISRQRPTRSARIPIVTAERCRRSAWRRSRTSSTVEGATMISSENGLLRGTVLLNVRGRDVGCFVDEAKAAIAKQVQLPAGYYISWSGQYENQQRARESAADRRADRADRDLWPALSHLSFRDRGGPCPDGGAVRSDGRHLSGLASRL